MTAQADYCVRCAEFGFVAIRFKLALQRIQDAIIDGKVCDDVAWFSDIETLHDFIGSVLSPAATAAIADLFPRTDEVPVLPDVASAVLAALIQCRAALVTAYHEIHDQTGKRVIARASTLRMQQ